MAKLCGAAPTSPRRARFPLYRIGQRNSQLARGFLGVMGTVGADAIFTGAEEKFRGMVATRSLAHDGGRAAENLHTGIGRNHKGSDYHTMARIPAQGYGLSLA